MGSVSIPIPTFFQTIWKGLRGQVSETSESWAAIIFKLRLPRTLLMAMAGASLASSGAAYQGLFRNPLADPYIIGVASGAGLGAVFAMSIQWPNTIASAYLIPLAAFIAGLLTVLVVFVIARVGNRRSSTNLILAGVAISSFATALTSFIMLRSTGELRRALVWLMGGSSLSGWQPVLAMLPYVIIGIGMLLMMGFSLNVLQFGDEQAAQLGLKVNQRRMLIVFAASLATAAAVSFTGIIGFIGLITPHVVRFWVGSDYRKLLPLSVLGGAAFLLFADVLARVLLAPQEVPVGIITALAGAPFFIWVLHSSQKGKN